MAKKKEAKDAGWDSEMTNTLIRCDMCSFETADRSYFMTHRVKSHMGPECVEKHVAKNRDDANYIFRQVQYIYFFYTTVSKANRIIRGVLKNIMT